MDKFMDIVKRYKEGNASEEERKLVELEIEKNRAINDFIADEFEGDFDFGFDESLNEDKNKINYNDEIEEGSDDLSKSIRKAVNKRFRKNIIFSVLVVVLIFVVLKLAVSPIMESMYYTPDAIIQGEYVKDMEYDMAAFTELNVPGYSSSFIYVDSKGFARYDLIIRRKNLFEGDYERISIVQKRDTIEGFFDYKFGMNLFMDRPGGEEDEFSVFDYKLPMEALRGMYSNNYVSTLLVFNSNKSLLDYWRMLETYDLDFKWLAVDTGVDSKGTYNRYLGFNPDVSDGMSGADELDRVKYPFFDLKEMFDSKPEEIHGKSYPEKMAYYYEQHFKTLLKYMIDSDEFVAIYDLAPNRKGNYEDAFEYVEENGVSFYAMLVFGEAEELIKMIESEDIYSIDINDVKVSKY